jgi:acyl-CoA synthetase (AMP-forming)/AMP-acid ligase II
VKVSSRSFLPRELRDGLAVSKLPGEIEFVESVPRASGPLDLGTGKLLRCILREKTA